MVHLDPAQRPTMEQVMQHPWMQGEVPSKDEVLAEFKLREEKV